jgi:hypothetical protein
VEAGRVNTLLFFHVLVGMLVVGGLITAAVTAHFELWRAARGAAIATLAATIAAIGLGEGLAAVEDVHADWLDVSRGLAVFGLLLGGAGLLVATGPLRTRRLAAPVASVLVLVGLTTAFWMAAKPS